MGLRAEESRSRAKLPAVSVRRAITAERLKNLSPEEALAAWRPGKERLALDWNPILGWRLDQVWEACGTSQAALDARRQWFDLGCYEMAFSGWPASPTYTFGLSRHSCAICCMSQRAEIPLAARFKPDLLQAIAGLEQLSGFAWQQGYPAANIHVQRQPIPPAAYRIQPLAGRPTFSDCRFGENSQSAKSILEVSHDLSFRTPAHGAGSDKSLPVGYRRQSRP
jgi:hypothetical protein